MLWRRERDSNPRYPCGYTGFRDRRLQPLGHLSANLYLWEHSPLRPANPCPDFFPPCPLAFSPGHSIRCKHNQLNKSAAGRQVSTLSGKSYFRVHKLPLTQDMSPQARRRAKSRTQGAGLDKRERLIGAFHINSAKEIVSHVKWPVITTQRSDCLVTLASCHPGLSRFTL